MPKYLITTDSGKYMVETESQPTTQPQAQPTQQQEPFMPWLGKTIAKNLGQAAQETYREGVSPMLSGLSTAAFGLPKAIIPENIRKAVFPEQRSLEGKALRGVSEAGGLLKGGASALGKKITQSIPKLAGEGIAKSAGRGAIQGGVYGATQSFPMDEGLQLSQRPQRAMTGAVVGGVLAPLGEVINKGRKWLKPQNQINLAQETRGSLFKAKEDMLEKYKDVYTRTIKNGTGKVSLQEPILNLIDESDDVVNSIKGNAEISEALAKGDPTAKRIMNIVENVMKNPQKIQSMSLQDADSLQKYIKNLPGLRNKILSQYKGRMVDFTNAERVLNNFANDIKAQVLNQSPEMALVNKEYGQFMNNFKQIRGLFKEGRAIETFKNFNNLDPEVRSRVLQTLPKDVVGKIVELNRVDRARRLAGIIGGGSAGAYIAHRYLSGKLLGSK